MQFLPYSLSARSHPGSSALRSHSTDDGLKRLFFRRGPAEVETVVRATVPLSVRSARAARIEAALVVADAPLSERKLLQFAGLADITDVRRGIEELNASYDRVRSAFRAERLATGYQLLTDPVYAPWLDRIHQRQARLRLSPVAMEILTIIAYRQPLTRADVEAVRGVQSGELVKQLMERGLVRILGEDDSLGRPYLYGTTRQFLEAYALHSLDELPNAAEMRRPMSRTRVAVDASAEVPEPTAEETGVAGAASI
jgi:segregation and condensation protein B